MAILLSIQTEHARRIYAGDKRAELRKSFPQDARLVFLYETAPVSAVTGAFLIDKVQKTSVEQAMQIAEQKGVSGERARRYYGNREFGWVVGVEDTIHFYEPLSAADVKELVGSFSPPQGFAYLHQYDALTQILMGRFLAEIGEQVLLQDISDEGREKLPGLIRSEVAPFYEDIDDDFIRQVLEVETGAVAAFSTIRKHVLEARWRRTIIGYTVLTEKKHGAWKSGPTIIAPEFRGLRFGSVLRNRIEEYCKRRGARAIYCTCSDAKPAVVSYLVNAGMQLQARLSGHLARDRDELVFAKQLSESVTKSRKWRGVTRPSRSTTVRVKRVVSAAAEVQKILAFTLKYLAAWYFRAEPSLLNAIATGMIAYERAEGNYSSKNRVLYGAFSGRGKILGVLLLTTKRSGMSKLNIVMSSDSERIATPLVRRVLRDFRTCRRLYVTVPCDRVDPLAAIDACGFKVEGILSDPFGT